MVVFVFVATSCCHILPAPSSAEKLRDDAVAQSDPGQRGQHLPERQGTKTQADVTVWREGGVTRTLPLVVVSLFISNPMFVSVSTASWSCWTLQVLWRILPAAHGPAPGQRGLPPPAARGRRSATALPGDDRSGRGRVAPEWSEGGADPQTLLSSLCVSRVEAGLSLCVCACACACSRVRVESSHTVKCRWIEDWKLLFLFYLSKVTCEGFSDILWLSCRLQPTITPPPQRVTEELRRPAAKFHFKETKILSVEPGSRDPN